MLSIRTDKEFRPLIEFIKENNVFITPFLNITESMEALHEKPYRTHRPPENTNRKHDQEWHLPRDVEKRPPVPPLASLYRGFAVRVQHDNNVYLVYNNARHLLPNEETMRKMGFDHDSVLSLRRIPGDKRKPLPHRILDNIPQGKDVPPSGVYVKITPSYKLRPLF